jgi:probable lipoprotein NlpC
MLFFNFKATLTNIFTAFLVVAFLASCSTSKKTVITKTRPVPSREVKTPEHQSRETAPAAKGEESRTKSEERKASVSDDKAEKVISTARTFIGTPYKYGGTTRSGMDCSALLINSFSAVKLNLPRSSEAQSKVGTEVQISDLKPGDLVFFATGNKKKEITHVGLITDVRSKENVKFIHASSSLGVVETNLFAEYYQKRFRVARRVIE